jgi:sugar lactone lactonase YvrE
MIEPRVIVDGLTYPESPRYHDGRLHFVDFYRRSVCAVDPDGTVRVVVETPRTPSGLGWLRDGALLVVSMEDAKVLRFDGYRLSVAGNLSAHQPVALNDMVVTRSGRAYISVKPEIDKARLPCVAATEVLLLDAHSGDWRVVATGLASPNGLVVTDDGRTLIVAETFAAALTAFDIAADGSLSNRRVWAPLSFYPDGICLDADGCVWAAAVLPEDKWSMWRIAEGGDVVGRVASDGAATVAVGLGGPDGRTLYMLESRSLADEQRKLPGNGRIRCVEVRTPTAAGQGVGLGG